MVFFMSNSKIHKVARKHATNFKQGYQASQNDSNQSVWIMAAIALAALYLILSALGMGR